MAKKPINVTIRKASSAQPSEPSIKAGFRAVTLYLPDALVERLTAHARGRDLNAVVAEILEKQLAEPVRAPVSTEDPVSMLLSWARSRFAMLRPAWM